MRRTALATPLLALLACGGADGDGAGADTETGATGATAETESDAETRTTNPTAATTVADSSGESDAGTGLPTGEDTDDPPSACEGSGQTYDDGLTHLGRAEGDTFIEILDLVTRDGLVYSCTATQGLTIWDATGGSGPTLVVESVGAPDLSHPQFPRCQHIALDATSARAVITNRSDEVQPTPWMYLYDLANPQQPVPLRGWSGDAFIEGVVVSDARIYAAAHNDGVLVFENQGGAALVQVGAFGDGSSDAWQPLLQGDTLFVAEGTTGIRAYDVSGTDPVLLSTLELPGSSKDVVAEGSLLYVAAASSLYVVDASDPSAMLVVGERSAFGTAVGLSLGAGGLLYVAEWDEVRAYDTSDPTLPLAWAEQVPTGDAFSRVLDVEADAESGRVYAGEWTGMHAYSQTLGVSAPDAQADPNTLQFGQVAAGESQTRVLIVRNTGTELLEVTNVLTSQTNATVSETCFDVEPGQSHAIEVRFDATNDGSFGGSVILETNDPDESGVTVSFTGNAFGADVGDPMPEFLLQDTAGNTWDSDELQGKVVVLAYFATF